MGGTADWDFNGGLLLRLKVPAELALDVRLLAQSLRESFDFVREPDHAGIIRVEGSAAAFRHRQRSETLAYLLRPVERAPRPHLGASHSLRHGFMPRGVAIDARVPAAWH